MSNLLEKAFTRQDEEFTAWWDSLPENIRRGVRRSSLSMAFMAGFGRGELALYHAQKEAEQHEQPV